MAKKVTHKAPTKKETTQRKRTAATATSKTKKAEKVRAASNGATRAAEVSLSEERIRERAYEISRARSGPADPEADWFRAERELRAENGA